MTAVLSRRGVLGAGAVAVGVGLTAGGSAASASAAPASVATAVSRATETAAAATSTGDPQRPVRSQFAGAEGQVYSASSQWSTHRLVLDEVGDLSAGGDPEHRFRVEFTSDAGARDGIYRLHVGEAFVASLFLARIAGEDRLQGIIDRGTV